MLFISEEQVSNLLNWKDTFRVVEVAMLRVSQKRVVQKARVTTEILNKDDVLLTMPGYLEDEKFGALACKLVTMFKGNASLETPFPTINAHIMVFDDATGILKAVMGGTEITKWRTAAASAVATKHIYVDNNKMCKILAILGCGVQANVHAEAFYYFFDFEEIRIWGRNTEKSKLLVQELNEKVSTNTFKSSESNEECVRDADVVITTTYASTPIVQLEWVKPGAHINAVGCGSNHYSELDERIYLDSDVYLDYWAGAHDSLAELEKKGVKFKGESLGMAVEDGAMARLILDLYTKHKEVEEKADESTLQTGSKRLDCKT
ncbi:hypothetical protein NQ315_001690 [Exocentrus adspersus]|uniref:Ketimine reductase mu-crystallin n=1 Tax=Exocentrus adspersus TaxID=1586481 RepID=A0AAV8WA76_9CUCU|nr:hypothetical protein NQ315_001690 [Exocentrus adspersus]